MSSVTNFGSYGLGYYGGTCCGCSAGMSGCNGPNCADVDLNTGLDSSGTGCPVSPGQCTQCTVNYPGQADLTAGAKRISFSSYIKPQYIAKEKMARNIKNSTVQSPVRMSNFSGIPSAAAEGVL